MKKPIVILDGRRRFQYICSTFEESSSMVENDFMLLDPSDAVTGGTAISVPENEFIFSKTLDPLVNQMNFWSNVHFSGDSGTGILPTNIHKRTLQIDVPDFNPSVYREQYEDLEYVIDVTTKIGQSTIVLACESFTCKDLLSIPSPYRDGSCKYHQYYRMDILDPWDIMYSDEYAQFRQHICKEIPNTNNCGSILDVSITVVNGNGENLIPDTRYSSGSNLIQLSGRDSDYMCLSLEDSEDGWRADLEFNSAYDGDILTYLEETYLLDDIGEIVPEIVIMDNDSIYKLLDLQYDGSTEWNFSMSEKSLRFDSWEDYIEGLYATAAVRIYSTKGDEIMDIRSNIVPVTKRKFSFMVGEETTLEDMDISVNNLDVVSKIQKNVIKMNKPEDYKSNIIRPVFYKSFPLDSIEVHDSVTFTISIDLDSYKTKSESFTIQIEGKNFVEIGRVPGGVLFKISGSELPHNSDTGKYYILDSYQELVAEGNYTYS